MFRSEPRSRPNTSSVRGFGWPAVRRRSSASRRSMLAASESAAAARPVRCAERANGRGHGAQVAVPVFVVANRRARQLRHQIGLTAVEQHEIRPERDDAFHIRIEQRADSRERLHLGRILVVAADRDDAIARADGEDHLGQRGHEADDPRGWLRLRAVEGVEGREGREGAEGREGRRCTATISAGQRPCSLRVPSCPSLLRAFDLLIPSSPATTERTVRRSSPSRCRRAVRSAP